MRRGRVVVGMSGGVDSSVAAALLHEQGYDVVGVTMRLWTEERPEELKGHQQCCSVEDTDDARRVAGQIGIRHYVMNFEREFREKVVDQFVSDYAAGRTPNPCVRCNEHIKYRALLDRLPALDADYVATGHYARVEARVGDGASGRWVDAGDREQGTGDRGSRVGHGASGRWGDAGATEQGTGDGAVGNRELRIVNRELGDGDGAEPVRYALLRGVDASKDQSYVLYMLQQEQLSRLLLPLGGMTKAEVRGHARRLGLDVAEKPDSVEICFVPGNDYRAFVQERVAMAPGTMVDGDGDVVGEHRGVAAYTVGQRKGLGIAAGEPRYVTSIDARANIVTIGPEEDLFCDTVEVGEVRWTAGSAPADGSALEAKARYKAEPAPARLVSSDGERAVVRFERRQRALTPGQAIAFYDGDEVLGGGTIERAWRSE